jgi:hypothetical protein
MSDFKGWVGFGKSCQDRLDVVQEEKTPPPHTRRWTSLGLWFSSTSSCSYAAPSTLLVLSAPSVLIYLLEPAASFSFNKN